MVLDIEKERTYNRQKKSHLLLGWVRRKEMTEEATRNRQVKKDKWH